jgi:hypothetical protein
MRASNYMPAQRCCTKMRRFWLVGTSYLTELWKGCPLLREGAEKLRANARKTRIDAYK